MKIERLDQDTKKNLLEDLLKRSPNSYGTYEESVRKILDAVREKDEMRQCSIIRKDSTARI